MSNWEGFKAMLPIEVEVANAGHFIVEDDYCAEEKHNGHHRIIVSEEKGKKLCMLNRNGEIRSLPEPLAMVLRRMQMDFVIDGEMLTGGKYIVYDLLSLHNYSLLGQPLRNRIQVRNENFTDIHPLIETTYTAFTQEEKMQLLAKLDAENAEGAIFKKLDAIYTSGKGGPIWKLKFWKTLSAIVGDRSTEKDGREKDGVDLLLYDDKGILHRISGCSLIGRVSVVKGDIIEVKYLYGTPDGHIVQPVMIMKRDDIHPSECVMSQIVVNKNWSK
jgi:ATP-dependent DNA ligase